MDPEGHLLNWAFLWPLKKNSLSNRYDTKSKKILKLLREKNSENFEKKNSEISWNLCKIVRIRIQEAN
jgi:hypothetical protein